MMSSHSNIRKHYYSADSREKQDTIRHFLYQKEPRYFATIIDGMEDAGGQELVELGATDITTVYRGIYFTATTENFYRINYCTRLLTRILAPLAVYACESPEQLYDNARKLPWSSLLTLEKTFVVHATVAHSNITHSHYAALKLKDAIVDQFRERTGNRPSINTDEPDILLNLHIEHNKATINLDTSGGSLHKRGYRKAMVDAPMKETTAAAIIRLSGWDGSRPLYDPMCGSGTLLCEALMSYCNLPPGMLRTRFGVEQLPDFNRILWQSVKEKALQVVREPPAGLIAGSDSSAKAISIAQLSSQSLKYGDRIHYAVTDFQNIESLENMVIVMNPPYGIRLGDKESTAVLYKEFGDFLKHYCKGSTAYIYVGDRTLVRAIGLKPTWKRPLKNGVIDGILLKIDVY
jgi:putative N6-adenine-specific DNA methylase